MVIPWAPRRAAGRKVICIGQLRRNCTVEGTAYPWTEYLLLDSQHGFKWLVESDSHWSLAVALPPGEVPQALDGQKNIHALGGSGGNFRDVEAVVEGVWGEFCTGWWSRASACRWRVRRPPRSLTRERQKHKGVGEVNWSLSTYLDPEAVWTAFKLNDAPSAPWHRLLPAQSPQGDARQVRVVDRGNPRPTADPRHGGVRHAPQRGAVPEAPGPLRPGSGPPPGSRRGRAQRHSPAQAQPAQRAVHRRGPGTGLLLRSHRDQGWPPQPGRHPQRPGQQRLDRPGGGPGERDHGRGRTLPAGEQLLPWRGWWRVLGRRRADQHRLSERRATGLLRPASGPPVGREVPPRRRPRRAAAPGRHALALPRTRPAGHPRGAPDTGVPGGGLRGPPLAGEHVRHGGDCQRR
ncbi:MAG: DUF4178 domain-containing protein [Holophagaceae bacterium]|nr:DUF4178 domain-containing protein [Holophagaceae bacterium]